jgi:hypothetical protein
MRWIGRLWRKRRARHSPSIYAISALDKYIELARQEARNHKMTAPWDGLLRRNNKSMVIFCSDECLDTYLECSVDQSEFHISIIEAPGIGCCHCGWCGDIVWEPDNCWVHHDRCTSWSWDSTLQAVHCLTELRDLYEGNVPPDAIEEARELGAAFGPSCNGVTLAQSVWAARRACGE